MIVCAFVFVWLVEMGAKVIVRIKSSLKSLWVLFSVSPFNAFYVKSFSLIQSYVHECPSREYVNFKFQVFQKKNP